MSVTCMEMYASTQIHTRMQTNITKRHVYFPLQQLLHSKLSMPLQERDMTGHLSLWKHQKTLNVESKYVLQHKYFRYAAWA